MGIPVKHELVKLIIGLIGNHNFFDEVEQVLTQKFGAIDFKSQLLAFDFTDYYERETGASLKRKFLSFELSIIPENLADIKLYTNEVEKKFSDKDGNRQVNIDPGYLTLSKLVLATTKDHQHRIYLGKGIFAECTLRYTQKSFTQWPWTYPDYSSCEYINIFNHIRNHLLKNKKSKNAN